MKSKKILSLIILTSMIFTSCSKVKDVIPADKFEMPPQTSLNQPTDSSSSQITPDDSDIDIENPNESTPDDSDTDIENPNESTSDDSDIDIENPNESTPDDSDTDIENPSEPTPDDSDTDTEYPDEPTPTTPPVTKPPETLTPPLTGTYTPLNYDVQKGVWISFLESEIKSAYKTEAQFRTQIANAYSKSKAMGVNTVYVHARSHGDAFYESAYFPWSNLTSGKIGNAPSYDPFEIMVEEAHKQGLSFHAWINPMRGPSTSNMQTLASNQNDNSIIKQWYLDPSKNGTYLVKYGLNYYLNPAYPEVQDLINNGITEIISKYKVDAIHIDDYFYPSGIDTSFDKSAYNQYGAGQNLADWRRSNTDKMVRSMYSTIKKANSRVLFGISPAGNVSNNYYSLYADIAKWCSTTGYMDYVIPQIYWGFEHPTADFKSKCAEWSNLVKTSSIDLIIGLATYKVIEKSDYDFKTNPYMMSQQIAYAKTLAKYKGVAFFRYASLMDSALNADRQNITNELK